MCDGTYQRIDTGPQRIPACTRSSPLDTQRSARHSLPAGKRTKSSPEQRTAQGVIRMTGTFVRTSLHDSPSQHVLHSHRPVSQSHTPWPVHGAVLSLGHEYPGVNTRSCTCPKETTGRASRDSTCVRKKYFAGAMLAGGGGETIKSDGHRDDNNKTRRLL